MTKGTAKWRFAVIFLCICMLLMSVGGCTPKDPAGSEPAPVQNGSSQTGEGDGKRPVEDLGNYHWKFLSLWGTENVCFNPQEGKTPADDAYFQRNKQLMEDYHFTMEMVSQSLDNFAVAIMAAAMVGDSLADIIYLDFAQMQFLRQSEVLLPFGGDEMPNIHLTDEKWSKAINEASTFGGKVYGVLNEIPTGVVCFYNSTLLQEKNITSPQELYKQDKWTWDEFLKLAKQTTIDENGDGTPEIYALGSPDWLNVYLEISTVYTNGGNVMKYDGNGKPRFAMEDNDAQEALNFMVDLYAEKLIKPDLPSNDEGAANMFNKREVAFVFEQYGFAGWIKDLMEDDYSIVPLPKGPAAKGYVSPAPQLHAYVAPMGSEDGYKASLIFDLLTEKLPETGDVTLDDPFYVVRNEHLRDDMSVEIYKSLADIVVPEQSNCIPNLLGTIHGAIRSCTVDSSTTPKSAMESIADQAQSVIDDFFAPKETS